MFHVTVERTICTAHGPDDGLHGHNWRVRATVSADALEGGLVVAPRALQALLWEVVEPLDHRRLEDLAPFASGGLAPTAVAVAGWVGRELGRRLEARVTVTRVDLVDGTGVTSSWTP